MEECSLPLSEWRKTLSSAPLLLLRLFPLLSGSFWGRSPSHPSPQAIWSPPRTSLPPGPEQALISLQLSPFFWAVTLLLTTRWTAPPGCPKASPAGPVRLSPLPAFPSPYSGMWSPSTPTNTLIFSSFDPTPQIRPVTTALKRPLSSPATCLPVSLPDCCSPCLHMCVS